MDLLSQFNLFSLESLLNNLINKLIDFDESPSIQFENQDLSLGTMMGLWCLKKAFLPPPIIFLWIHGTPLEIIEKE